MWLKKQNDLEKKEKEKELEIKLLNESLERQK